MLDAMASRVFSILSLIVLSFLICAADEEPTFETMAYVPYFVGTENNNVDAETVSRLIADSLSGYDTRIRPRLNQSHTLVVNVSFTPVSVVNLDTAEQKLDVLGFFDIHWADELITWKPSDYNGLNNLKLPLTQIWRPRIVVLKSLKTSSEIGSIAFDTVKITATNSGSEATVNWVPEDIYSVLCELDVKFYPFDVQNCHLQYYASDDTYHSVYLKADPNVPLTSYTENAEWKLTKIETQTVVEYETNIAHVSFQLERRAQFTLFTIMIPLLMLSILDVAGFLIPIESGEKISYMVTLFLTFGFFVFILRDGVPHNSLQVSYFLIYLIQLSAISVVSVIYSILESQVFQTRGDKEFTLFENKVFALKMWSAPISGKNDIENPKDVKKKVKKQPRTCTPKDKRKNVNKVRMKWTEFLRKLDMVFAAIFTLLVFIFTVFFFATVLNR